MWYEMKRQFIDAAARVMWADAWGQQRENLIEMFRSGELSMDWEDQTAEEYVEARGWPRSMQGVELTDAAPPTPDYARLEAAILLGKLESANGASLAEIVKAAETSEDVEFCRTAHAEYGNRVLTQSDQHVHETKDGLIWFDNEVIDVSEFAADIALQALGHGVSWFDDHERFTLGDGRTVGTARREFKVPRIEFTYEEGELS